MITITDTTTTTRRAKRTMSTTREDGPKWIGPLLALMALATSSFLLFSELFELLNLAAAIAPFSANLFGTVAALLVFPAVKRLFAAIFARLLPSGLFPALSPAVTSPAPVPAIVTVSSGTQAGESYVRDVGFHTCGRPAFCCKRTEKDLSAQFLVTFNLECQILGLKKDIKLQRMSARASDNIARAQQQRLARMSKAHGEEMADAKANALANAAAAEDAAAAEAAAAKTVTAAEATATEAIAAEKAAADKTIAAAEAAAAVAPAESAAKEREELAAELALLREELALFRPDPFARAAIVSLKAEKARLAERVEDLELAARAGLPPPSPLLLLPAAAAPAAPKE